MHGSAWDITMFSLRLLATLSALNHVPVESFTIEGTREVARFVDFLGSPIKGTVLAEHHVLDFPLPRLRVFRVKNCAAWPRHTIKPLWPRYTGLFKGDQYNKPMPLESLELMGDTDVAVDLEETMVLIEAAGTTFVEQILRV
ncbi:hypothetical protein CALCODRAFT_302350 [Calocera cornea HHB12733]|uniref:Uncharacterized protein n=1 Tax=Calocera cornea HHB12733 TaxID=1353952 RepID=A0A165FIX4_9BASI|nr:hypothetical protein CALCODRAFT_302350 [Calocera cornea HHB12733]